MTTAKQVNYRYILWSTNFEYQHSRITITPFISRLDKRIVFKWKIYLQIIPFYRWLFNKQISYKNRFKFLKEYLRNTSQLNTDDWYEDKKSIV